MPLFGRSSTVAVSQPGEKPRARLLVDEGRLDGCARHAVDLGIGKAEFARRPVVFLGKRCTEEGWIVGIDADLYTGLVELLERMAGEIGEDLERDVGARADFEHGAQIDKAADKLGILDGTDAVADACWFDDVERIGDAEGAADFAGMDGEAEAGFPPDWASQIEISCSS